MNQSEFNLLVTNVTAIANQTFTIQCGGFVTALDADKENEFSTEPFDINSHMEGFNFQEILESGYGGLNEVENELNEAWSLVDRDLLESSVIQLPKEFSDLTKKLTASELKQWITHTLEAEDESLFYVVHRIIMALFQQEGSDIHDLVREAIAFDELTDLIKEEKNLRAEHIQLDDLETALTIQSFKAFEWLVPRAKLDDDNTLELLKSSLDDHSNFERILLILAPSEKQRETILSLAKSRNEDSILELLSKLNQDKK